MSLLLCTLPWFTGSFELPRKCFSLVKYSKAVVPLFWTTEPSGITVSCLAGAADLLVILMRCSIGLAPRAHPKRFAELLNLEGDEAGVRCCKVIV